MVRLFYLDRYVLQRLSVLSESDRTLACVSRGQRFYRMRDPEVGLVIPDMADHLQKTSDIST
jgi:hypothetical protein